MDAKRLVELSKLNPDASKKTAEGFGERLKNWEKLFDMERKSVTMTAERMNRSYDI